MLKAVWIMEVANNNYFSQPHSPIHFSSQKYSATYKIQASKIKSKTNLSLYKSEVATVSIENIIDVQSIAQIRQCATFE